MVKGNLFGLYGHNSVEDQGFDIFSSPDLQHMFSGEIKRFFYNANRLP